MIFNVQISLKPDAVAAVAVCARWASEEFLSYFLQIYLSFLWMFKLVSADKVSVDDESADGNTAPRR